MLFKRHQLESVSVKTVNLFHHCCTVALSVEFALWEMSKLAAEIKKM